MFMPHANMRARSCRRFALAVVLLGASVQSGTAADPPAAPAQARAAPGAATHVSSKPTACEAAAQAAGRLAARTGSGPAESSKAGARPASAATPPLVLASLDGVHFEPVPLRRPVRDAATGRVSWVEVPRSQYKAQCWVFSAGPMPSPTPSFSAEPAAGRSESSP